MSELTTIKDLLESEIKDLYSAENQHQSHSENG
jgi:hypothetical protein